MPLPGHTAAGTPLMGQAQQGMPPSCHAPALAADRSELDTQPSQSTADHTDTSQSWAPTHVGAQHRGAWPSDQQYQVKAEY